MVTGNGIITTILILALIAGGLYLLFRHNPEKINSQTGEKRSIEDNEK